MSLRQNALLLVLLAALIAIGADWSGAIALERWWCAPLGLLLLGLAFEAWATRRAPLRANLNAATQWLLCRPTPMRLELRSARRRAAALEVAPTAPTEVSIERAVARLELPVDAPAALALTATARRLGRFEWPPVQMRISGALGLAWWRRSVSTDFALRVVPDVLHDSERALDARAGGDRASPRMGAGGEIVQLRDYRAGDPPRSIDWKASARTRRLISRDFSEDQHLEIVIAVDVSRASGLAAGASDRLALYVNIAARIAQRAAALDDRIGLLLYADQPLAALAPGRGIAAVTRLRSLLGQARVQPTEANHALAAVRIRSLAHQRSMVLMLTDLDDAGMASALIGAARLLLPKHLPFIASVRSDGAQALAHRPASEELEVYEAIAAQRYCAGLARNIKALRTLGADCVLAPAGNLDRAVLAAYLGFRRRRRV
ncbi:MAG TPA: DUF58 domain-containing protein [Steroidobacteraceae bacterium]